jgi:two-component system OmpR family response regulator
MFLETEISKVGRYHFGGWQFDRNNRCLTDPTGCSIALAEGEYAVLAVFLDAPQRPLSRTYLRQAIRAWESGIDLKVELQILRLRRILEDDTTRPQIILTERGVGYLFALAVERF